MAGMNDSEATPELLDQVHLREVLDLMSEDEESGAFARWIVRLDTELAQFRALLATDNKIASLPEIAKATHSLRGTCLMMGASALACLFAELETHAKAGNRADVDELYAGSRELEQASLHALREAEAKY